MAVMKKFMNKTAIIMIAVIIAVAIGAILTYQNIIKSDINAIHGTYRYHTQNETTLGVFVLLKSTSSVHINWSDFYLLFKTNANHIFSNQSDTLKILTTNTGGNILSSIDPLEVVLYFALPQVSNSDNSWTLRYNGSENVHLKEIIIPPPFS
jgi:hypothetical protein